MDLDQSILSTLPLQQRQKVCRQIRQKQVEKYLEHQRSEGQKNVVKERKANKKKTKVHFGANYLLQDAVESFDDKEVVKQMTIGGSANFTSGNGTTLLHRCATEDNRSAAALLIKSGADVNAIDDDWWTPLHTACSCDSSEVLQLLLKKGADATLMDVDGYFPIDHAPDNSDTKAIITVHLEKKGLKEEKVKQIRQRRPREMLDYVKSLPLAVNVNELNSDGAALIHIAVANGYKSVLKMLLKYEADLNVRDDYGWTPLHVAAHFNQLKCVEILLRKRADPNLADPLGSKPSAVANSDEIRAMLMRYERKHEKMGKGEEDKLDKDFTEDPNIYDEIEDKDDNMDTSKVVGIFRINSKITRAKHGSISKEDELSEAKLMYESIFDVKDAGVVSADAMATPAPKEDEDDEEEEEEDYVSAAIWKTGPQEEGKLPKCMDADNLTSMGDVQEEKVLTELQNRYKGSQIYTFIADILVAVNPFKELPLYAKPISMKYHAPVPGVKLPPHIYSIAENAYSRLLRDHASQCCVISGESGAGKTESCKYIVQHLLRVAGSDEMNLSIKINQVNPLLEAFGNALTVMNNNSSRFGKFVEICFTPFGKVMGARITEYLLEKSRIVLQGRGECNLHIFYWMMSGLSPEEMKVYSLENMKKMRYLQQSGTDLSQHINSSNKQKFWEVKDCLKFIGFSQADIENVFLTLATVLHLGQISFVGVGNNDAAQVHNADILQKAADIMEVNIEELGSALVAEYSVTRGEQIKKERNVQQAEACRDALAKALYSRLFSWIVNGINQLIHPMEQSESLQVGILDIFGFENFPHNSFEQLCINLANEQIQLYTNDHVFFKEQQDCLLEGVPLVDLDFKSNQELLDLFLEKHVGVLAIMDEESNFPKATDKSLATKLHQVSGKKYPMYYKTPKDGGENFTVVHYAGSITYSLEGVLEKNRDTLPNGILYTMKTSNRLLIKELFQAKVTRMGSLAPSARQQRSRRTTMKKSASPFEFFKKLKGGNKDVKPKLQPSLPSERKGPSTMAYHFRNSLSDLVTKLQASSPHFVRCLKPNTTKSAMKFVPEYVLAQLRYTGISDIIKIRKFGYAMRLTFQEFLARYQVLVHCYVPKISLMSDEKKCREILRKCKVEDVKIGKSKMFFKTSQAEQLDKAIHDSQRRVVRLQSVVRGFLGRQKSKKVALSKAEQLKKVSALLADAEVHSGKVEKLMRDGSFHDEENHQMTLKKREIAEITKSLESLDDILNIYDEVGTLDRKGSQKSDIYDDVAVERRVRPAEEPVQPGSYVTFIAEGETETDTPDDDMNGHISRGLPATPTTYMYETRPPPCPREMYGTGMYSSIDEPDDHRRQAPPPPKRNPETRLSSSSSMGTYEAISVEMSPQHRQSYQQDANYSPRHQPDASHSPRHQPDPNYSPRHHLDPNYSPRHQPDQNYSPRHQPDQNYSPRHQQDANYSPRHQQDASHSPSHVPPGSPRAKPPSPQAAGNKPFSYLGAGMAAPKLHKHEGQSQSMDGQYPRRTSESEFNGQDVQMRQQATSATDDRHSASPATSYGKSESVFHPPPHRPPPAGPPPPPPPGGQSIPSPKMSRHSIASTEGSTKKPRTPVINPKLSQRSRSMPTNADEEVYLPEPPPPLSVRENYMAAALHSSGPPSPPLPPPPPEMIGSLRSSFAGPPPPLPADHANPGRAHGPVPVPPPVPPAGYQVAPPPPVAPPVPQIGAGQQYNAPPPPPPFSGGVQQQAPPPPPPPLSSIPTRKPQQQQQQQGSPARGGHSHSPPVRGVNPSESPSRVVRDNVPGPADLIGELNKVQLKKTGDSAGPGKEAREVTPVRQAEPVESRVISGVKLRVTPGKKIWDVADPGLKAVGEEQRAESQSPPPPTTAPGPRDSPQPQAAPPSQASPGRVPDRNMEVLDKKPGNMATGDSSSSSCSRMEIDLDNIDLNQVPGYVQVTNATPVWKREMIEKKNQEKIEDYVRKLQKQKEEKDKWKNVPAWKRRLMEEKEKLKEEQDQEADRAAKEEEVMRKRRSKEAEERKREQAKLDKERDQQMQEEMQAVPAWKREVMMKRGGAIKNWGDERETINEHENQDGFEDGGGDAPTETSNEDGVVCSRTSLVLKRESLDPFDIKRQNARPSVEEEKILEDWENIPEWKREIMMKRGAAPSNWGDERDEVVN